MCIGNSVGDKGKNGKVDVKVIQAALNLSASEDWCLDDRLTIDGDAGKKTTAAIASFQSYVADTSCPAGMVKPGSDLLCKLQAGISRGLSIDSLTAIMAHGSSSKMQVYLPLLRAKLPGYQITTALRTAHFLAQVGHESLSFTYTEELASGSAYEGRVDLGNTEPGDGKRFKGRGLIQLTGRSNYAEYGSYACLNLLKKGNEKVIANTPAYALDVSLWFWQKRKLNEHADKDDLRAVTRRVNGGYNGLADRQQYLDRAKFFLIG